MCSCVEFDELSQGHVAAVLIGFFVLDDGFVLLHLDQVHSFYQTIALGLVVLVYLAIEDQWRWLRLHFTFTSELVREFAEAAQLFFGFVRRTIKGFERRIGHVSSPYCCVDERG